MAHPEQERASAVGPYQLFMLVLCASALLMLSVGVVLRLDEPTPNGSGLRGYVRLLAVLRGFPQ